MQSFRFLTGTLRRPFWVLLLVAASVVFTFGLACAMPFAALCAAAACTLPRRDACCAAGAAWAANQVIGFAFLHYPWTANCLAWGAAIGLSALLCTLAAQWVRGRLVRMNALASYVAAFAAAFAAFEASLAATSLVLGGTESFTLPIMAKILAVNILAWVGFFAMNAAGAFVGSSVPSRPSAV